MLNYHEILLLFLDLVIQCRKRNAAGDTSSPLEYFQKGWSEYKEGFGDIESDYWVGLETLHNMTSIEGTTWRLEVSILLLEYELSFFSQFYWDGYNYIPLYKLGLAFGL